MWKKWSGGRSNSNVAVQVWQSHRKGCITKLLHLVHLFPLLPLEHSFLGAAAAAAPPVAAAQAPFSCSSPLLFVRLLFFPLLFFWLGILQDSDDKCNFRPLSATAVNAVWHFCGLHFCSSVLVFMLLLLLASSWTTGPLLLCSFDSSTCKAAITFKSEGVSVSCFHSCSAVFFHPLTSQDPRYWLAAIYAAFACCGNSRSLHYPTLEKSEPV